MTTIPNKIKELIRKGFANPYAILVFWLIYQEGKIRYEDLLNILYKCLTDPKHILSKEQLLDSFLEYLEDKEHIIIHTKEDDTIYYSVDYGRL
jgi:hypothetical protein